MLAFLRTTTPWFVPLVLAAAVAAITWIIGGKWTAGEQLVAGASAGAFAAIGLMIRFQEKRHPDELWRPQFDVSRAQKIAGAAALGVGLVDLGLKFVDAHYAVITGFLILALAWVTGALWNVQKLTRLKENEQWTS